MKEEKMTWLKDYNGNKCSVEYFGSKEAAQKALDSLKNCRECVNCSGCSDCYDCYGCYGCSGCSGCSDCYDCYDCYGCSDCSRCYGCSRCSRCSRCYRCYGCYGCSGKDGEKGSEGKVAPEIPIIPEIHKAVYAAVTQKKDALDMSTWHACETTHCRGGWVVTLAGEAGKAAEKFYGTALAAQLIYDASDPSKKFNPCRFYDSNDEALADMKKLADGAAV